MCSRGKADIDSEAAAWLGLRGDHGVVCVGDGLDDGEAEADTLRGVGGMGSEPLEGLEETLEFAGRDQRAGVGDGENSTS